MGGSEIPIDPELLDDAASEVSSQEAGAGEGPYSSGLDDDSGDEYVESDQEADGGAPEGVEDEVPSAMLPNEERDEVFSRLATRVGETAQGETSMNPLVDLETEIARADAEDMMAGPLTRRQTRQQKRTAHKPSYEVQRLVGRGNMAYAKGDIPQTIALFKEVIRHDPLVIAAWNTLGSVYEEEGNDEGARQMRFFAAHVEDEAETWKELAVEFRQRGQIHQCVHCLRKALAKDTSDVSVLFELASIYRLQNNATKAIDAFKKILRLHAPSTHDFIFLNQFHPILCNSGHTAFAASSFRIGFDWHIARCKPGDPQSSMKLDHVVKLVDDLMSADKLEEALVILKRGQRWLQGRSEEMAWDAIEDDREYDPENFQRTEGPEEEESESYPLETSLRHRLALIRLRLGNDLEAMIHIDELLNLDAAQYHGLFRELGRLLMKRELWRKALDCLAEINECDEIEDDVDMVYEIAICHHQLGERALALEALQHVTAVDPRNTEAKLRMATVLDEMGRKDEALEMVEEVIRERAQRERGPETQSTRPKMSKSDRASERKLTKRVLEDQMRTTMQELWAEVQLAEVALQEGDPGALDRFIQAAGTMIENFRLAKGLYNKNRGTVRVKRKAKGRNDLTMEALALQDRLERTMGLDEEGEEVSADSKYIVMRMTQFHGLDSEQWLNLIIKYCAVLMIKNEEDVALDILTHVIDSALFANRRCEIAIRMSIIACAMRMKAYDKLVEQCQEMALLHQFRPEPLLLLQACLASGGRKGTTAWEKKKMQRFLHRQLRLMDDLIKGAKASYIHRTERWTLPTRPGHSRILGDDLDELDQDHDEDEEEEEEEEEGRQYEDGLDLDHLEIGEERESFNPRPTIRSPALNAIYGQIMLSTGAHQSALFYLLRAYELTQHDPCICLCIALAFFGRSANRQSDNRNYQITQGFAFLSRYRNLSPKVEEKTEEVEYNYGRAFHGLGVPHLAIQHYERVLASVERRMKEAGEAAEFVKQNSLAYEAAHNLMQLYASVGNVALAKERSKWLAI